MRILSKSQDGFSAVEVLLLLVIVGIIGGVGYFVMNSQKKTNTTLEDTSKSQGEVQKAEKKETKVDPTTKWLKYISQNGKYSASIPDGWELLTMKGEDNIHAWNMTNITYSEGKSAKVDVLDGGGRDGSSIAFHLIYNTDTHFEKNTDLKKVKTYTNANQVSVTKSTRTQTSAPDENGMDIPKGTTEYVYLLTTGGKKITIVHDVLSGETDQTQRIEQLIDTLKFL
jgi:hypothetical protein